MSTTSMRMAVSILALFVAASSGELIVDCINDKHRDNHMTEGSLLVTIATKQAESFLTGLRRARRADNLEVIETIDDVIDLNSGNLGVDIPPSPGYSSVELELRNTDGRGAGLVLHMPKSYNDVNIRHRICGMYWDYLRHTFRRSNMSGVKYGCAVKGEGLKIVVYCIHKYPK